MARKITVEIISALLVILFCYAAVSKLENTPLFRVQLGKSPLTSGHESLIAIAVPCSELMISMLLIFRSTRFTGLILSFFIMLLFTIYIIIILNFSYYVPCSCGGVLQGLSWRTHVIFNCTFLVLIIIALIAESKKPHINQFTQLNAQ